MSSLGVQTKQGFLQIQKEMQTFTCILQGRDQLVNLKHFPRSSSRRGRNY